VTTGILLIQLGSPDTPEPADVRRFLREFLSDPLVVQLPRILWLPILYGPILLTRPRKTAELYRSIWTPEGSPLLVESVKLVQALREELDLPIALGMRYGNPSLRAAFAELRAAGAERVLVLPLFPQYSQSTNGSALAAARVAGADLRLELYEDYPTHPRYIQALADSVRDEIERHGVPERWLLSFHGIPQSQVRRGDPYADQCAATADALVRELGWADEEWELVFQSRFGPQPWLQPYADVRLDELGREGLKSVAVLCPGFAADCLETVEELGVRGRETFVEAGGGELRLVPCLNASRSWVLALRDMLQERLESL